MKYKLTPINITCGLLIIASIYGAIYPGPMGFGVLGLFFLLPIALFGLLLEYFGQKTIKNYLRLFLVELALLMLLSFGFIWQERTKIYIIPDQREFEFIVTIYNVEDSEKLQIDLFTWTYEKEIPDNGILLTSSNKESDLPQTKVFTKSGLSLQDKKNTVDLSIGSASTSKIKIDSKTYDYQAWKIDKAGTIVYSTNDIKELEVELKEYLTRIQNSQKKILDKID